MRRPTNEPWSHTKNKKNWTRVTIACRQSGHEYACGRAERHSWRAAWCRLVFAPNGIYHFQLYDSVPSLHLDVSFPISTLVTVWNVTDFIMFVSFLLIVLWFYCVCSFLYRTAVFQLPYVLPGSHKSFTAWLLLLIYYLLQMFTCDAAFSNK